MSAKWAYEQAAAAPPPPPNTASSEAEAQLSKRFN